MFGKYTLILVGLLALTAVSLAQFRGGTDEAEPPGSLIDIDTELGKEKEEVPEESGSGNDSDDEEDDDLEKSSGSGSGAEGIDASSTVEVKPTTTKTLTPCQNLREASKHLLGNYVPRCDENGDYGSRQCRGHPSTGKCWCSDKNGAEIPGTVVAGPEVLNCETGKNLSPCLYMLVKNIRNPVYGSYRPRCKVSGAFEERQCHGSICFCVNEDGQRVPGSERPIYDSDYMCQMEPATPDLIIPVHSVTKAHKPDKSEKPLPTRPVYTVPTKDPNVNVKPPVSEEEEEADTESPNATGDKEEDIDPRQEENVQSAHIMTQPGLLAAIIGGAVVGLLCAILLVMFIVYRMRKKDEGSYALDEPRKKSTYSPINQSDKEFYA